MKTERIIWGLIFVFIGGVLLLENLDLIHFHWETVWRFWPLILIVLGANLLLSGEHAASAGLIAILITVLALVFVGYQGMKPESSRQVWDYPRDEGPASGKGENEGSTAMFKANNDLRIRRAELNISGGATRYLLSDSTTDLFYAEVSKRMGNYSLRRTTRGDTMEVLNFKMSGKQEWNMKGSGGNKAIMKLNTRPEWDINLEVGAGKIDLDLRPFKVRKISFEGGASSFKLKLPAPQQTTIVDADTGISEIEIDVPRSTACRINVDSGLSSNDFEGFVRKEDGSYETAGFQTATRKIIINLEGGLSKFEVNRY